MRAEGNRRIQIDKATETDTGWELVGWAADVNKKLTPDMIYVFAGDQLIASAPPNSENKNVVRWFDSEELLASGFTFDVDGRLIPHDVDQLTVVAEFQNLAVLDHVSLTR